jgi:hypothetical protein
MLSKANEVRERWRLDIDKPLTVNDVFFQLKATAKGIEGGIGTRDGRYSWRFSRNTFDHFYDTKYRPRSFRHKDEESARLAKMPCKITSDEAETVARDALHRLNLTEEGLGLKEPALVNQYMFEESDGVVYPLPMFQVSWRLAGQPETEGGEAPYHPVVFEISGVTKGVAEYFNVSPHRPFDPLSTNFFQLLGLPDNYRNAAPEKPTH